MPAVETFKFDPALRTLTHSKKQVQKNAAGVDVDTETRIDFYGPSAIAAALSDESLADGLAPAALDQARDLASERDADKVA